MACFHKEAVLLFCLLHIIVPQPAAAALRLMVPRAGVFSSRNAAWTVMMLHGLLFRETNAWKKQLPSLVFFLEYRMCILRASRLSS